MCLAAEDGRLLSERSFDVKLIAQPPSGIVPTFWRGPIVRATAILGLEPGSLSTQWEWPEPDGFARGSWLCRYPQNDGLFKFARLPDLMEVNVPDSVLPSVPGRESMFADALDYGVSSAPPGQQPSNSPVANRRGSVARPRKAIIESCGRVIIARLAELLSSAATDCSMVNLSGDNPRLRWWESVLLPLLPPAMS